MSVRYETRSVLAGAYRGRSALARSDLLTHVLEIEVSDTGARAGTLVVGERVLCSRVQRENLTDEHGHAPAELAEEATCKSCRARDPRFGVPKTRKRR